MERDKRLIYSPLAHASSELRDLTEKFLMGIPKRLEQIAEAIELGQWTNVKVLSHKLKGAAGSFGYRSIAEIAGEMESAAQSVRWTVEEFKQKLQTLRTLSLGATV